MYWYNTTFDIDSIVQKWFEQMLYTKNDFINILNYFFLSIYKMEA